jgi:hypothetical protein
VTSSRKHRDAVAFAVAVVVASDVGEDAGKMLEPNER